MTMLKQILNQAGIREFGICPMPPGDALLDCRAKSRLPENARSVIVCLFPYYSPGLAGNISRYAMVEDYHKVAREILSGRRMPQNSAGLPTVPLSLRFPRPCRRGSGCREETAC